MTDRDFEILWIHRPSTHGGALMPQLYDCGRAVVAAAVTADRMRTQEEWVAKHNDWAAQVGSEHWPR